MKNIKIKYKNKILKSNLFFGGIWLLFGIISLLTKENIHWSDYGYIVLALLYFAHYIYVNLNPYIRIEDGVISTNTFLSKKISLYKIQQIKKIDNEYILVAGQTELKINTSLIEDNSLKKLNTVLNNLDL